MGLSAAILIGSAWILFRQLRGFEYATLRAYLFALPPLHVAAAVLLTGLNFVVLTGYDALALRYVQVRLPLRRLAFSAFVGYGFSQSIGSPLLTGGSVRYRLYSRWELGAEAIGKAVLFAGASFFLGFLTLGGVLFLGWPGAIPADLDLPVGVAALGVGCLVLPLVYVGTAFVGRAPIRIGHWSVDIPPLWMLPAQVGLAAADLLVAAGVLYALLPPPAPVSFVSVVAVYLAARLLAIVSHVPGGLGVFETAVLGMLAPSVGTSVLVGVLLGYRAIFHLLPLGVAGGAFFLYEMGR